MDLEITTHAPCSAETLPALLERFAQCLEPLGADTDTLRAWLATLEWYLGEDEGCGWGLGPQVTLRTHGSEHMELVVNPHLFLYPAEMLPGSTGPWVALSLVLEDGTIAYEVCVSEPGIYPDEWRFPRAFGVAALDVMWRLMHGFPDDGVYLADDGSMDVSWVALFAGGEGLWGGKGKVGGFDLALIPDPVAPRYSAMPEGYAQTPFPGAIGFTRLAVWIENPLDPLPEVILHERTQGA
jgi:hypothetical protein